MIGSAWSTAATSSHALHLLPLLLPLFEYATISLIYYTAKFFATIGYTWSTAATSSHALHLLLLLLLQHIYNNLVLGLLVHLSHFQLIIHIQFKHTAPHCIALQHAATHCHTPQSHPTQHTHPLHLPWQRSRQFLGLHYSAHLSFYQVVCTDVIGLIYLIYLCNQLTPTDSLQLTHCNWLTATNSLQQTHCN